LVERGHDVTVLTSHFDACLPREEKMEGIRVVRVPVAFKLSKGVIMPLYGFYATKLVKENDVLSIHVPQFDAWGLALRGKVFGKPAILTYHCDLQLPPGLLNRVIDQVTYIANLLATLWADRIVTNTQDFAEHSRLLRRTPRKIEAIVPPVDMPSPREADVAAFKKAHDLVGKQVIGFVGRFASEKGVEVLIDALPGLKARFPDYKVLFTGPYKDVVGEERYRRRLFPRIEAAGPHWEFLGTLDAEEMPAMYASLDCLVVPSLNMTESFGLVQVEAMLCGTPVVASDLPGVRQPVLMSGMGEIVPIGDSNALLESLTRILSDKAAYQRPRTDIENLFGIQRTVDSYERIFQAEIARKAGNPKVSPHASGGSSPRS